MTFAHYRVYCKGIDSQTNVHIPLWVSEESPGTTAIPYRLTTCHREVRTSGTETNRGNARLKRLNSTGCNARQNPLIIAGRVRVGGKELAGNSKSRRMLVTTKVVQNPAYRLSIFILGEVNDTRR